MSNVPANPRTTPAHRRWPNAASTAATKVSATPMTVIWLGVIGMRPTADINASALRRTQASNRVVNIHLLDLSRVRGGSNVGLTRCRRPRLVVDLDDLRSHDVPPIAAGPFLGVWGPLGPGGGVPAQGAHERSAVCPTPEVRPPALS